MNYLLNGTFEYEKNSDFVDYVNNMTKRREWFANRRALWNRKHEPPVAETLTRGGIGFSFNMLNMEEILNVDL